MERIRRLLAALISRHTARSSEDSLAEDADRAAELCAAGQLTADEYAEVKTQLDAIAITER